MRKIFAIIMGVIAVIPLCFFIITFSFMTSSKVSTPVPIVVEGPTEKSEVYEIEYISSQNEKRLEVGSEFLVKSCKVLDGFKFSVLLDNDTRINASLAVVTKEGATSDVMKIMQVENPPSILLKRNMNDHWIVDFKLSQDVILDQTSNNGPRMLSDILKEKNLVL